MVMLLFAMNGFNGLVVCETLVLGFVPHPNLRANAYRELFSTDLDYGQLHDIREALNQELVLGNSYFKDKIESMTDRRVVPGIPGRPKILEEGGCYFVYLRILFSDPDDYD